MKFRRNDLKPMPITWKYAVEMIAVSGLRKTLEIHGKTLVFRRAETALRNRGKTKPKSMKFHRNDLKSMQITWKYAVEMIAVSGLRKTLKIHCKTLVFRRAETHQKPDIHSEWRICSAEWKTKGQNEKTWNDNEKTWNENEKTWNENEMSFRAEPAGMKKPRMRMKKPRMRMKKPGMKMVVRMKWEWASPPPPWDGGGADSRKSERHRPPEAAAPLRTC